MQTGYEIEVAVEEEDGEICLMYPFERHGPIARPMGWPMNDFQAALAGPGRSLDAEALLKAAGVKALEFDHLLHAQGSMHEHVESVQPSPFMEVAGGISAYRKRLGKTARSTLATTLRLGRKADRQIGPVRFEIQVQDVGLLDTLVEWKSRQYVATGVEDFLSLERPRKFLTWLVQQRNGDEFCGVLSATWAGEQPMALHVGMRARGVLHWWFPTYNTAMAEYGPGRLMLAQHAEQADEIGLHRIDLGRGDEVYKQRCMTGSVGVAEGYIETRLSRRALRAVANSLRKSRLLKPLRQLRGGG